MNRQGKIDTINNFMQGIDITASENEDLITIASSSENIFALCGFVKKYLNYDYLQFLTCIDRTDKLEIQYHIYSYGDKGKIIIKAGVERINGKVKSVSSIWKTAFWLEREVYDLFGVVFEGHPGLRRIILDDDFEGYPLLKDFTSKNLVKLPKI